MHLDGQRIASCLTLAAKIEGRQVLTIEGLQDGDALHPMQQAWLDRDVSQCGYCQPGQIMEAVALVKRLRKQGRALRQSDLDSIRNICRCGTYHRIREAIEQGARNMR